MASPRSRRRRLCPYFVGRTTARADRVSRPLGCAADAARYAGRDDFADAVARFGGLADQVDLLAEFGSTTQALLLYDMHTQPFGTLRVAEHFTIGDGLIRRIRHVHDTAALRPAR
jgi:hypothetical protein